MLIITYILSFSVIVIHGRTRMCKVAFASVTVTLQVFIFTIPIIYATEAKYSHLLPYLHTKPQSETREGLLVFHINVATNNNLIKVLYVLVHCRAPLLNLY